jgi:UDP-N-acetylmuramoyl-tripeptide--D-alanyl-D-alanine ligase
MAMDALSALAVAHALGVGKEAVLRGLSSYKPVGMRMRIEEHSGGITVLNDAYNANPASTQASLRTLAAVKQRRRVALLGDMLELGEFEAQCHRELVEEALESGVEVLGFVGPRYRAAVEFLGVTERVALADSAEEMGAWLSEHLLEEDVLLIKGSRGLAMERVVHALGLEGS